MSLFSTIPCTASRAILFLVFVGADLLRWTYSRFSGTFHSLGKTWLAGIFSAVAFLFSNVQGDVTRLAYYNIQRDDEIPMQQPKQYVKYS
ncbi:hypothetical protein KIN20_033131 [Parelaphostrongylus tenuis]|uniref:Uncharacterized protein n=1 Tax=Parelaphostrongylus tenuis TaxID=148309 RepID=A0AAD5R853_PARTN|nr:hypothetical protein KIN20_033131 [Parelaphostrongylus tenuis]